MDQKSPHLPFCRLICDRVTQSRQCFFIGCLWGAFFGFLCVFQVLRPVGLVPGHLGRVSETALVPPAEATVFDSFTGVPRFSVAENQVATQFLNKGRLAAENSSKIPQFRTKQNPRPWNVCVFRLFLRELHIHTFVWTRRQERPLAKKNVTFRWFHQRIKRNAQEKLEENGSLNFEVQKTSFDKHDKFSLLFHLKFLTSAQGPKSRNVGTQPHEKPTKQDTNRPNKKSVKNYLYKPHVFTNQSSAFQTALSFYSKRSLSTVRVIIQEM